MATRKRPVIAAFEEGVVTAAAAFLGAIIATGAIWPPTPAIVYAAGLPAILVGVGSWARARGISIQAPEK